MWKSLIHLQYGTQASLIQGNNMIFFLLIFLDHWKLAYSNNLQWIRIRFCVWEKLFVTLFQIIIMHYSSKISRVMSFETRLKSVCLVRKKKESCNYNHISFNSTRNGNQLAVLWASQIEEASIYNKKLIVNKELRVTSDKNVWFGC